jgi:hypothetical protein
MARTQRVAHYIQRLTYENLLRREQREVRPSDAPARAADLSPHYASWTATSYSGFVPFRAPTDR